MAKSIEELERAYEIVSEINADDETRYYISRRDMAEREHDYRMECIREEAIEQGIEQGIEKGIEQGIEKGKLAGIIETAKNMLLEKISIETISKITGLPVNKIMSI